MKGKGYNQEFLGTIKKSEDQLNLGRLILNGKESNSVLRETANSLHELAQKLNGEFPREIYEYDKQDKKALTYLEMLEMNADYLEVIIEDIIYSLGNLKNSIN